MIERAIRPNQSYLHGRILALVQPCDNVLDVGAGLGLYHHLLHLRGATLDTLDAHPPYVNLHKIHARTAHTGTIQDLLPTFKKNAYEVALAIDVVEHLEKEDALLAIGEMTRIASQMVIIFTPLGFHPQDRDNYGMGGDYWQTHRSAWQPEELEALGFAVEVWTNFHHQHNVGALFAWR